MAKMYAIKIGDLFFRLEEKRPLDKAVSVWFFTNDIKYASYAKKQHLQTTMKTLKDLKIESRLVNYPDGTEI